MPARSARALEGRIAAVSIDEYWAEGTQFWFNSNQVATFGGRVVLSDTDLKRYDPALYRVLGAAYGDVHRIAADVFYKVSGARAAGAATEFTAEVC